MSDPVPVLAIYDATTGGRSVIVVSGGASGDVLVLQDDGTYAPEALTVDLSGYAQLSGATFIGAVTASGITTRNGLNPTSIKVHNTYTSGSDFGALDLRANAAQTAYEISSIKGAAGGANLPIQIGHRAAGVDGAFTSGLSVATNGAVTASSLRDGGSGSHFLSTIIRDVNYNYFLIDANGLKLGSNALVRWSSTISTLSAADISASRNSVGVLQIGNGELNALGSVLLKDLTASGTIIQVPPASVTLGTNGQFSIEMTSNTEGNLVYRGSDGTTRRMALLFS